jgi:KaiC/GvpD/RAD55 family RecA-like ATPase
MIVEGWILCHGASLPTTLKRYIDMPKDIFMHIQREGIRVSQRQTMPLRALGSGVQLVKTGLAGFDETFGGLPDKTVLALMGGTGTGTELFAQQFLFNAARRGVNVVYSTIEKPPSDVREELESIGVNLKPLESTKPPRWNFIDAFSPRRTKIAGGAGPLTGSNLLTTLKDSLTAKPANHYTAIDSLSYLLLRYDIMDVTDLVEALIHKARKEGGVHLLLTNPNMHDPKIVNTVLHIVDGALEFIREEKAQDIEWSLRVRKMKKESHKMGILPFRMTERGITFETTKRIA